MKVYFTGSLHNRDIDTQEYQRIVAVIKKQGHKVMAPVVELTKEHLDAQTQKERAKYYQRLKRLIGSVEVVIGEVSYPSTINIGHEITLALDMGKPTVVIYKKGREPGVLLGIKSERFIMLEYTDDDLEDVVKYGLEEAQEQMDVRFNFFISPKIGNYLDMVAKKRRLPRAVYLRRLIEEDMKKNKEYQES